MYDAYILWFIVAAVVLTVWLFFRRFVRIRIRRRGPDGKLLPIRIKDPKIIAQVQFSYGYQQAHGMFAKGQYAEAVEAFQAVLKMKAPDHLKGAVRSILADCYDGLGEAKKAEEERTRAEASLKRGKLDFTGAVALANLLARKGNYKDACGAYEQALAQVPKTDNATRQMLLVKLAQAAYHAGRAHDATEWASQAIQYGAAGQTLMAAHSISALSYTDLGDLDRAEQHRNTAKAIAQGGGDDTAAAVQMATQSGLLCSRGQFDEALVLVDKALEITGGTSMVVHESRYKVLKALGRFQESLEAIQAARRLAPPQPSSEAGRINAAHCLAEAGLHAELGNPEEAIKLILEVKESRENDPVASLTCDALMASVMAGSDRRDEARKLLDAVEKAAANTELSRIKALDVLGCLVRGAFDLEDYVMAKRIVEQCIALKPNPSSMPSMNYYLGECQKNLGDLDAARRSYEAAVAPNIESRNAKKARERLLEMDEVAIPN